MNNIFLSFFLLRLVMYFKKKKKTRKKFLLAVPALAGQSTVLLTI